MVPSFAKYLPLLSLKDKRLDELTLDDLRGVAGMMGIELAITDELKEAGLALLQGKDINTVADMIQSPESITQLLQFLQGKSQEQVIAEAELLELYQGELFEVDDFTDYPTATTALAELASVSDLISSPLVGWRLPG